MGGEELRRITERKSSETRKIKRRPLFFNKTCPERFFRCRFSPGGSSLDFNQPQFHKNSLKKEVGGSGMRERKNIRPCAFTVGKRPHRKSAANSVANKLHRYRQLHWRICR